MKTLFITTLILGVNYLFSQQLQQVVATTGNNNLQNNVQISYTVGETLIQTLSTNNHTLTQGFQQPHYNITLLPQHNELPYSINVYPNPTKNELFIDIQSSPNTKLTIQLFDMSGKCLNQQEIISNQSPKISLPMHHIAAGKYLLNINDNEHNQTKTFEIIKTN